MAIRKVKRTRKTSHRVKKVARVGQKQKGSKR